MNALLFPGQGSQVVGMGLEFYNNFDRVKKIFKQADEKLNKPISKIILEGPEDELKLTENTQPAILTVSYSIFSILKDEFNFKLNTSNFYAGHSLGEYSALVCSGSLNFFDALYLLSERGKAMQEAVPVGKGKMIAILGSNILEIQKLIKKLEKNEKSVCEIANDNAEGQTIISGDVQTINLFQEILKENKKKFIPLNVSAPFHCTLMKPAAEIMKEKINKTNFSKPISDVINNVTAEAESNPETIKQLLIQQIYSTVKWRESILMLSSKGVKNFIEIGPGKVLTGMVKRTLKDINSFSINSINDIKNLTNEFKK
jgi:[acyl-carrier-protein] S-malonyltransferase